MENRVTDFLPNYEQGGRKDRTLSPQRLHKSPSRSNQKRVNLQKSHRSTEKSTTQKRLVSSGSSPKKRKPAIHQQGGQKENQQQHQTTFQLPNIQSKELKIQRMFFVRWMKKLAERLQQKQLSDESEFNPTNDSESLSSIENMKYVKQFKRPFIDSDLDFEMTSPPPPSHDRSSQGTFDNTELTDTLDPEVIPISGSFDITQPEQDAPLYDSP